MIFFFAMPVPLDAIRTQTFRYESTGKQGARLGQVLGRVDAEWYAFHDHGINAHAGVERAQLLQFLTLLVDGWWQFDKPFERRAAISIEADMVIVRAGAGGIFTRECFRVKAARRDLRSQNLHNVGIRPLTRITDQGSKGSDVDLLVVKRRESGPDVGGLDCR